MEPVFINNITNEVHRNISEKVLSLFNQISVEDNELAVLLVKYLIRQISSSIISTSKETQTECESADNGWDMKDITNEVKQVAEQCMNQNGLNYDGSSGTYYNSEQGYYYIPDYKLYYYPRLSAYYYYDDTTDSLKFHSSVAPSDSTSTPMVTDQNDGSTHVHTENDEENKEKNVNIKINEETVHSKMKLNDKEEGELSSSDEEGEIVEDSPNSRVVFESGPKAFEIDHSKHNAPCMRIVIVKTNLESYKVGTLFLITRDGGTLGREGTHHDIVLPECNVSKDHLRFQYVYKGDIEQRYAYEVVDLGSKNGTWVNGKRLSNSNEQSEGEEISHGSVITIGSTSLLCHIHRGLDSCCECQSTDTCETKEVNFTAPGLSSKQQHHKQKMQMKQKYLLNAVTEVDTLSKGYVDRAKVRRDTVGSSHHSEKTEVSSVDLPMSKKNKGYNLLSKMGWKEGSTLGKNNSPTSLQEPLYLEPKTDKSGFGA